jgi:acyl-CoA reductase-like NAD-dependent aldehyde dehydrogenase
MMLAELYHYYPAGSPKVGWQLKREAGKKRVALELGGNAAVLLDHMPRGGVKDSGLGGEAIRLPSTSSRKFDS